jgi:hypothetical protein
MRHGFATPQAAFRRKNPYERPLFAHPRLQLYPIISLEGKSSQSGNKTGKMYHLRNSLAASLP